MLAYSFVTGATLLQLGTNRPSVIFSTDLKCVFLKQLQKLPPANTTFFEPL
jgi:hypothetical protein